MLLYRLNDSLVWAGRSVLLARLALDEPLFDFYLVSKELFYVIPGM